MSKGELSTIAPKTEPKMDPSYAEKASKLVEDGIQKIYNNNNDWSFESLFKNSHIMIRHGYGEKLYSGFVNTMTQLLREVGIAVQSTPRDVFLQELYDKWLEHKVSFDTIQQVLGHIDRSYVRRCNKTPVSELELNLWRDNIVRSPQIKDLLLDRLLDLVHRARTGEQINTNLMRSITIMFRELGPTVYDEDFEKPFLIATADFYRLESQRPIETTDCVAYLKKAEGRRREEFLWSKKYLFGETMFRSASVVRRTMVQDQLKVLAEMENSGFVSMLVDDKYDDLVIMYDKFGNFDNGLQILEEVMIGHLRERGERLFMDPERWRSPVHFVQALLDEKDK